MNATYPALFLMKDTKQLIRELIDEVLKEMTSTGAVAGYMTPAAFRGHKSKKKVNNI